MDPTTKELLHNGIAVAILVPVMSFILWGVAAHVQFHRMDADKINTQFYYRGVLPRRDSRAHWPILDGRARNHSLEIGIFPARKHRQSLAPPHPGAPSDDSVS